MATTAIATPEVITSLESQLQAALAAIRELRHAKTCSTVSSGFASEESSAGESSSAESDDEEETLCKQEQRLVSGQEQTMDSGVVQYQNQFRRTKVMVSNILVEKGITNRLATEGKRVIPERCHKSNNYLVTDTIVDALYGDLVLEGLRAAGLKVFKLVTQADQMDETGEPSAERFKTLQSYSTLVDSILESGIDKNSCIISLGGGVVNNICGFIAASLYRGITLVHFSTSMMGQVDAAIDFKQAVNHHKGKNLMGAYHPATQIILDPEMLVTLTERHVLNGLSEAVKHAITQSREMLDFILQGCDNVMDVDFLEEVVKQTIAHKVPTLSADVSDDYNEMCPQYGHSIGHAVEFLSFKHGTPLLHGEAIAVGMCVSAEVAYLMGICNMDVVEEHYALFKRMRLPVYVPEAMTLEQVCEKLTYDKHFLQTRPTMGLVVEIGTMYRGADGRVGRMIDPSVLQRALLSNVARRDAEKSTSA